MERTREQPSGDVRCPWCHTEVGEDAVVCPRDRTPIHHECLHEFGMCPICHLAVEEDEASPDSSPDLVVELPRSHWHVPELPAELAGLRREVRELYPRPGQWLFRAVCLAIVFSTGGLTVTPWAVIPMALLVAWAMSLVRKRWEPTGAALLRRVKLPRPDVQAAERLATGDKRALNALREHRRATHAAQRATERVRRMIERRRAIYRTYLANRTPIEEAQQITGIGPGLTDTLRRAGITNLRELSRANVREVEGIGPARARALRNWVADREEAIGRLVEGEQFPGRAEIDARLEDALSSARASGDEAVTTGERALTYLEHWHAARQADLATLCLGRRPPSPKR